MSKVNSLGRKILSKNFCIEQIPGIFLWQKNIDCIFMESNNECAVLFGFNKSKDLVGLTDYDIPCKLVECADIFQKQDRQVMLSEEPLKVIAMHFCANNEPKMLLTTKSPLYDNKNNIIGTLGWCVDISKALNNIHQLFVNIATQSKNKKNPLSNSYIIGDTASTYLTMQLSPRQLECLFFLLRGKTYKEIARILELSPRTIEKHVDILKEKFSSQSKNELINNAIEKGFMYLIPESLFQHQFLMTL